jgi:hypothetical protein
VLGSKVINYATSVTGSDKVVNAAYIALKLKIRIGAAVLIVNDFYDMARRKKTLNQSRSYETAAAYNGDTPAGHSAAKLPLLYSLTIGASTSQLSVFTTARIKYVDFWCPPEEA